MGSRDLAEKWWAYGQYLASREWYLTGGPVPHLLVVAPDAVREALVARSLSALGRATPDLTAWTTTASELAQQGPLGAAWRRWTPEVVPVAASSPFAVVSAERRDHRSA
jgi:hypothetical protein